MHKPRTPYPKPYDEFPLTAHTGAGQWCKKIRGKTHYFGALAEPQAALNKWLDECDDLMAGRTPARGDGLTVKALCNEFLTAKSRRVESGELATRTLNDYQTVLARVVEEFGKMRHVETLGPSDFETLRAAFAKTHKAVALGNDITRVRCLFNYCDKTFGLRVRYGDSFDKPTRKVLRLSRQSRGPRMFTADEIRSMLDKAGPQLRAMIYLGVNCGFGNNDATMLPIRAIDFGGRWINFGRPKTGIHRRCPLWPETVAALRAAIEARPEPADESLAGLVFLTRAGQTWHKPGRIEEGKVVGLDNTLSKEIAKLVRALGIHRPGLGFYALRHTFQTIGEKSRDKDAVRAIMGHVEAANDMSAVYSEEPVEDERLKAVTDYVRAWLFPKKRKPR
jgi:integrase